MRVNALQIRQSFGKILKQLMSGDEPIIIEKAREPVAVLISLKTFQERFVDLQEQEKRDELLSRFKKAGQKPKLNSTEVLRQLRYADKNH